MSPSEELQWFAEHVQPYEPAVRSFLASRFPSLRDQDDVVQESFARMLRAQTKGDGIRHARAFFFSTAHNVAVDLFRRRARNEHVEMTELHELSALEEARGVGDLLDERQRHETLAEALASLPERCREVVQRAFPAAAPAPMPNVPSRKMSRSIRKLACSACCRSTASTCVTPT